MYNISRREVLKTICLATDAGDCNRLHCGYSIADNGIEDNIGRWRFIVMKVRGKRYA